MTKTIQTTGERLNFGKRNKKKITTQLAPPVPRGRANSTGRKAPYLNLYGSLGCVAVAYQMSYCCFCYFFAVQLMFCLELLSLLFYKLLAK